MPSAEPEDVALAFASHGGSAQDKEAPSPHHSLFLSECASLACLENLCFFSTSVHEDWIYFRALGFRRRTLLALFEAGMPMCLGTVCLRCFQGSEP